MFGLPLAHINTYFILDGKKYEIEKFNIKFSQSVDFKGQPQHETKGGQIMITLNQAADDNLYLWAKKSTLCKDGEVLFQTDLGMSVLRINFEKTYCINLKREIGAFAGSKTTLVLSPEKISLNDISHNNDWKKE